MGSPLLSESLQESWRIDGARQELLSDYLWACSLCCGESPAELLRPIFDEWAALPEKNDEGASPRAAFGDYHVRLAFRHQVPDRAIGYFLQRAQGPELRWPLLVGLNGVDHPDALEFVVKELARLDEEMEGTDSMSIFSITAVSEWIRRAQYGGEPMTAASRQRLYELWSIDGNHRYLRRRALKHWCATVAREDIAVLKAVETSSEIGDVVLFERLRRGDETAIRELVERLEGGGASYWWQAGRYLWSDELTECLDRALGLLANEASGPESDMSENYWMLPELLMKMPRTTAARLDQEALGRAVLLGRLRASSAVYRDSGT